MTDDINFLNIDTMKLGVYYIIKVHNYLVQQFVWEADAFG